MLIETGDTGIEVSSVQATGLLSPPKPGNLLSPLSRVRRRYARRMTTRMTVAVAVLTFGLAVAALAGIPAFIENRAVGDIAMLVGFAIALMGFALLLFAIPGQRRQNGALKVNDAFEVERLRVERRRLGSLLRHAQARLSSATMMVRPSALLNGGGADVGELRVEVADLEAAMQNNEIELRRRGADPSAD